MANNENLIPIPGRLHSVATEGHVSGADEIYDDTQQKDQETINSELIAAVGTGGSVDTKITNAINALDATVSQSAGNDGLALSVTEENGKVTAISGSIAANTYDAHGAASTAKNEVLGTGVGTDYNTLKKIEDKLSPIETAVGSGGSIDTRIANAVAAETTRAEAAEGVLDTAKADKATTLAGYGITDAYTKTEVDDAVEDCAYLGANDGSAVIADFDPQTDTVWKKAQVLSAAEKEQVQQNIGVREWLNTLTGEKYVSVAATDQTTTSNLKALIDTVAGSAGKEQADTIYRVGKWDGSAYNEEYYSDYAWDGSAYVQLNKKSIVGEVFDITEYKAGAKYADLAAALGNNGENVPQNVRKGGMSVKYVNTDNKYVQYRLMSDTFNTTPANWQGVDDVPAPNNRNLVESSGVAAVTDVIGRNAITILNDGWIRYSDGTIGAGDSYKHSNNIIVQTGQIYAICCKNGSANPAAVAAYDSNDTYLQEYSVVASTGLKRFLYTVPENVHHIIVTGEITETISAVQLSNEILNEFFVLDKIRLSRLSRSVRNNGEYYTGDSSRSCTVEIEVSKGDVFFIEAGEYSSCCVVAAYDSLGNYIYGSSIIGTGQPVNIDYCVPDGISKIVVCNNTYIEDNPVIIKKPDMLAYYDYSLINLSLRIDNTSPKIPTTIPNLNTGWIKLSDGSINSGDDYRYSDPILVNEGDIFVYNGGVSASVAVVAMYTSSSATSNDYVQSSSIAGTGEATNIEFTIPHGIVAIRLCDDTILVPLGNLSLYKRNPLYSDFTTVNDVKTIVSDNMFAPVSRNRIRISPTRKAVFSFNFDDLRTSDKAVFDIFQNYGFLPSYALSYENITESNIKLYKEMYIKGCSILGHGATADATTIKYAYTTLTGLGFVVNGFVTPNSVLPDNLKPFAASIYGYCFTVGSNAQNVLPSTTVGKYDENASRFNLARLDLEEWNKDAGQTIEYLKACVDDAIENKLLIVFYGHQIPSDYINSDGVTSSFTVEDLKNLLQYIKTKVDNCQCVVLPTDEAVSYYYNMVNPT